MAGDPPEGVGVGAVGPVGDAHVGPADRAGVHLQQRFASARGGAGAAPRPPASPGPGRPGPSWLRRQRGQGHRAAFEPGGVGGDHGGHGGAAVGRPHERGRAAGGRPHEPGQFLPVAGLEALRPGGPGGRLPPAPRSGSRAGAWPGCRPRPGGPRSRAPRPGRRSRSRPGRSRRWCRWRRRRSAARPRRCRRSRRR